MKAIASLLAVLFLANMLRAEEFTLTEPPAENAPAAEWDAWFAKQDPILRRVIIAGEIQREAAIAQQADTVKQLRAQLAGKLPRDQVEDKRAELRQAIVRLNELRDLSRPFSPSFRGEIAIGHMATAPVLEVVQIIDERSARVRIHDYTSKTEVYLTGADTSGWVDGSAVSYNNFILISGNHTYTTAAGAPRTVLAGEAVKFQISGVPAKGLEAARRAR